MRSAAGKLQHENTKQQVAFRALDTPKSLNRASGSAFDATVRRLKLDGALESAYQGNIVRRQ
jgi:hypothetical protein